MSYDNASLNHDQFLISIRVSAQGFGSHGPHYQQVANYLAMFAGSKHKDPKKFTATLSTILTQLLEAIFQHHERNGEVVVTIAKLGQLTGIKLEFPTNYENKAIYVKLGRDIKQHDPQTLYQQTQANHKTTEISPILSFLQVVNQYQATLETASILGRDAVRISIKLDLEG